MDDWLPSQSSRSQARPISSTPAYNRLSTVASEELLMLQFRSALRQETQKIQAMLDVPPSPPPPPSSSQWTFPNVILFLFTLTVLALLVAVVALWQLPTAMAVSMHQVNNIATEVGVDPRIVLGRLAPEALTCVDEMELLSSIILSTYPTSDDISLMDPLRPSQHAQACGSLLGEEDCTLLDLLTFSLLQSQPQLLRVLVPFTSFDDIQEVFPHNAFLLSKIMDQYKSNMSNLAMQLLPAKPDNPIVFSGISPNVACIFYPSQFVSPIQASPFWSAPRARPSSSNSPPCSLNQPSSTDQNSYTSAIIDAMICCSALPQGSPPACSFVAECVSLPNTDLLMATVTFFHMIVFSVMDLFHVLTSMLSSVL